MFLKRSGYLEECYFTFSYSPSCDETGSVVGVFTPVLDTTERVLSVRRLQTLRDVATNTAEAQSDEGMENHEVPVPLATPTRSSVGLGQ